MIAKSLTNAGAIPFDKLELSKTVQMNWMSFIMPVDPTKFKT